MIQSNELRIGNYINDMLGGQCECRGYSIKGIYIRDKSGPAPEDAFSGIALTTEWLNNLGFKIGEYDNFIINTNDYGMHSVNFEDEDECWVYRNSHSNAGCYYIKDFIYVHQLQNLFFVLTGEELTLKSN